MGGYDEDNKGWWWPDDGKGVDGHSRCRGRIRDNK